MLSLPPLLLVLLALLLAGIVAIAPFSPAAAQEELAEPPTVIFPMPSAVTNSTTVRIGGSPLMAPINKSLKRQFEEQFPGTEVQIEDGPDTSTALQAVLNGDLDLAAISRPLTAEEKAQGLRVIPVSQDKVAILISQDNPFNGSLTLEQLAQVFRGEITDWAELGREPGLIRIVDRPPISETRLALERYKLFPEGELPITLNRVQLEQDDTQEMIRELGRNDIGYAIANQVRNQPAVKPIKIAILQTTLPGDALYPYSQVRGYAYRDETDSNVKSFLGFTSTDVGRDAIATARKEEARVATRPVVAPVAEAPNEDVATLPPSEPAPGFSLEKVPVWVWFLVPVFPLFLFLAGLLRRRPRRTPQRPPITRRAAQERTPVATPVEDDDILDNWEEDEAPATAEAVVDEDLEDWEEAQMEPSTSVEAAVDEDWENWEESEVLEPSVTVEAAVDEGSGGREDEEAPEPVVVLEDMPAAPGLSVTSETPSVAEVMGAIPGLFSQGMELFEGDRFEEALPYFQQITEQQPDRSDAWVLQGQILLALERLPEALDAFEQSLGLDLSLEAAWIGKGDVLTRLGRTEEAQASYQQAAELEAVLTEPSEGEAVEAIAPTPEAPASPVLHDAIETAEPALAPSAKVTELLTEEPSPSTESLTEPVDGVSEPAIPEAVVEELVSTIESTTVEESLPTPDPIVVEASQPEGTPMISEPMAAPKIPEPVVEEPAAEPVTLLPVDSEVIAASEIPESGVEEATPEAVVEELVSTIESTTVEEPLPIPEPIVVEASQPEGTPIISEPMAAPEIPEPVVEEPAAEPVTLLPIDSEVIAASEISEPGVEEAVPVWAAEAIAPVAPAPLEATTLPSPITADALKQAFQERLRTYGKTVQGATPNEAYLALASVLCDHLLERRTPEATLIATDGRLIAQLSAEYLPGPHLRNALVSLECLETTEHVLEDLGLHLTSLLQQEEEPGLGRGNLGRLMMDYLDSLATQDVPAIGYGLRYEYGIFDQEIRDGWQVEVPDNWLLYGNPWEVERGDRTLTIQFGGYTQSYTDEQGRYRVRWVAAQTVQAQCFDTPVPGYATDTVNLLRLWRANTDDSLCKVLYPVNGEDHGANLRLRQQFFLVSCAVQDLLRMHQESGQPWDALPDRLALHLNDTDTLLAIAELMRLLVDVHELEWEAAWDLTQRTLTYSNHSLLPEALDDFWSVALFEAELPRHLQIIYEINARFLDGLRSQFFDNAKIQRMSLIGDGAEQRIRLTNLACIGTHAVNGVSRFHTQLLEQRILPDFYSYTPDRFHTITNGMSQRRFLAVTNPLLAELITRAIGQDWLRNPEALSQLEPLANDDAFCAQWQQVKRTGKENLAGWIQERLGQTVNPDTLFDGQATVIHEYKRQHLNVLHILTLYHRLKTDPNLDILPRTFLFSGKASPDYTIAKLMIKLITTVAERINTDPDVAGRLTVLFLPDFTQKLVEVIYPALDLSEHLSLAGTEAADTANMAAVLNGALLIGTPDGSNLELQEILGEGSFFPFGLTEPEAQMLQEEGYRPWEIYERNTELKAAIDAFVDGSLTPSDPQLFRPLVSQLLSQDPYRVLADYTAYTAAQEQVGDLYRQPLTWTRQSIRAVARMGRFSSDRAIQTYQQTLWQVQPRGDRLHLLTSPPYG
ncbi:MULTISPECIES: glycogen/starch/alpha-glucan family phosphorylase [unclassified Leptolyngbya]|uniref:glycogen/starch/alpha-glucan family phosphorylase n=1 Tax=unclassified Leptolyngbya TaxID=2650499 RepID=UPI001683D26D|nr:MULTISPECIES: glycogen/starch/alpha-glucan family phosphorylase [unclassified Leptolyngbya]MBD1913898.1 glycogen/starch/alpha-glucan family phosphorylase [Leptolyngbya sp. FACHB-8]MBD2156350.1 glycogen/starch/alpha-glucan family phosphorylase [Leptolyngbya sp. FACHB-16]